MTGLTLDAVAEAAKEAGVRCCVYHAGGGVMTIAVYREGAEVGGYDYSFMIGPDGDDGTWTWDVYEDGEFVEVEQDADGKFDYSSRTFEPATVADAVSKMKWLVRPKPWSKHKPLPRGQVRMMSSGGPATKSGVKPYKFHIPSSIARLIDPEAVFQVEVTDEGVLYRYLSGQGDSEPPAPVQLPRWITGD